MNDELILNNYLLVLKSTVEVYVHGTLESSNSDIRKLLKASLDETLKHQASVYDKMVENDWYCVDNTKCSNIENVYNKVCNKN